MAHLPQFWSEIPPKNQTRPAEPANPQEPQKPSRLKKLLRMLPNSLGSAAAGATASMPLENLYVTCSTEMIGVRAAARKIVSERGMMGFFTGSAGSITSNTIKRGINILATGWIKACLMPKPNQTSPQNQANPQEGPSLATRCGVSSISGVLGGVVASIFTHIPEFLAGSKQTGAAVQNAFMPGTLRPTPELVKTYPANLLFLSGFYFATWGGKELLESTVGRQVDEVAPGLGGPVCGGTAVAGATALTLPLVDARTSKFKDPHAPLKIEFKPERIKKSLGPRVARQSFAWFVTFGTLDLLNKVFAPRG